MALHIAEYYDYGKVAEYMKTRGIVDGTSDNMHDDPIITLNMFIDDPNSVRFNERVKAGKATINGVNVADKAKNTALAKQIVEFRATQTVEAINRLIAAKKPRRRHSSNLTSRFRSRLQRGGPHGLALFL